jgi:hypothetical protein
LTILTLKRDNSETPIDRKDDIVAPKPRLKALAKASSIIKMIIIM